MDFAKRILMVFLCCVAAFVAAADGPAASAEKAAAPTIPWKLPSYTLVARDMDLRVALETFAVAEGLSVVMSQSVPDQILSPTLKADIQTGRRRYLYFRS